MRYLKTIGLFTVLGMFIGCKTNAPSTNRKIYTFCVGTYTKDTNDGIHVIEYNSITNKLSLKQIITGSENPSYIIANKNKNILFVGEEVGSETGGKVSSYFYDEKEDTFTKQSSLPTKGDHTCVIAVDKKNRYLIAGNYSGGNIIVFSLDEKGTILKEIQRIDHFGSNPNSDRQEKSHIHDLVFQPNQKKLFVTDLGSDKIYIYDFNPKASEPLKPSKIPFVAIKKGSGPRHLIFNQKGTYFYVINELTADMEVYSYSNQSIILKQSVSLALPNTESDKSGAEIKISVKGKYLYATNRGGYNEINTFVIHADTHELYAIQRIKTEGKTPRSFEITPDGKYILIANQDSDNVTIFKVLPDGTLQKTGAQLQIPTPVHVVNW